MFGAAATASFPLVRTLAQNGLPLLNIVNDLGTCAAYRRLLISKAQNSGIRYNVQ